MTTPKAELRV